MFLIVQEKKNNEQWTKQTKTKQNKTNIMYLPDFLSTQKTETKRKQKNDFVIF